MTFYSGCCLPACLAGICREYNPRDIAGCPHEGALDAAATTAASAAAGMNNSATVKDG